MSREENIFYISEMLGKYGISCVDNAPELLYDYYTLLTEKNKVMNLTRITDFEDAVVKHFLDSLIVLKYSETAELFKISENAGKQENTDKGDLSADMQGDNLISAKREKVRSKICLADIGSGAGIPGIPLKIACPNINITSVDSVRKKIDFQNEAAANLGLIGFEAVHTRIEDFAHECENREKFDICTFRAVSQLSVLCEYGLPLLKVGGHLVAYKSADVDEEVKNAKNALKKLGGKIADIKKFEIEGAGRSLVVIEKTAHTPARYPRKAGTPVKSPL